LSKTAFLICLRYDRLSWYVRSLTLIPSFALTISCLEKRKPLTYTARRRGWVGCNILLFNIPSDARIPIVADGTPAEPETVRRQFARLQPLEKAGYEKRGWTLDVLNVVRSLDKVEFSLSDVYSHTDELQHLHPKNKHVHEKIRQQLQQLRGMGLVRFAGGGKYLLTN
jgi:type II restriction enzyme